MQTSLEGLTLHVEDVERSKRFYARLPGAVLIQERPGRFVQFQFGSGRLGLLSASSTRADGPGFHIEMSAPAGAVDTVYEQVRGAGIEPDGPPVDRPWGERAFRVTDPDGNRLEFDSYGG